jgi:type I restriction enzyme, S subunit
MEKQKGKRPPIRFSEFKDNWEHKVLNELLYEAKFRNGDLKYGKDKVLSVSGELGIVNQIEHLGRSYAGVSVHQYHVVEVGDIVYTKSPLKANPFGIIKLNKREAGIVSTLYAVYKVNKKTAYGPFIDYYFSLDANTNRYLRPLVKKGAKNDMKINNAYVLHDRIYAPTLSEQQKIASFLSAVDEKIQQLTRKKELLEQYKKGVMQQLFPPAGGQAPKLRFKDENGKAYPKWEEKLYEDIFSFYTTNSFSRENLNYETGEVKNIHYGDIHTKFSSRFEVNEEVVPYINANIDLSKVKEENYCKEGDLVIADASEDYADIGKTIELIKLNKEKVIAGLHTFLARPNKAKMHKGFSGYLVQAPYVRKQVMTIAQGTKVLSLSPGRLGKVKLEIPCTEEQQKIASYLSSLDTKIESVATQITQSQTFKKGLLQQMFV